MQTEDKTMNNELRCTDCGTDGLSGCIRCFDEGRVNGYITDTEWEQYGYDSDGEPYEIGVKP